jgi:hypothetical protein
MSRESPPVVKLEGERRLTMRISVECNGKFEKFQKGKKPWDVPEGVTAKEVSEILGIDPDEVKEISINHKSARMNTLLNAGDEIRLSS